jgi:hypothetical protein
MTVCKDVHQNVCYLLHGHRLASTEVKDVDVRALLLQELEGGYVATNEKRHKMSS